MSVSQFTGYGSAIHSGRAVKILSTNAPLYFIVFSLFIKSNPEDSGIDVGKLFFVFLTPKAGSHHTRLRVKPSFNSDFNPRKNEFNGGCGKFDFFSSQVKCD